MSTQDIRTTIQQAMRAAFPKFEEQVARFYAMQEYHLGWRDIDLQPALFGSGKLIRSQLAIHSCCVVGGNVSHVLPLAAGIQLIHDFSLIHDDIEDKSTTRRGRKTVWAEWGLAQGINAGDGMFVIAHLSLHRMSEAGVPATVVLETLKRFDETILTICEGQFLDLSFEGNLHIHEADYLSMISRKTAALIAAATGLGAIVGNADLENAQALFDFGQNLGLAFQMQDDILGIWGDPDITGKPYAADLYGRKISLPVIHALMYGENRAELERIYRQDELGPADIERLLAILQFAGAHRYAEEKVAAYHALAQKSLNQVQPADTVAARTALEHIQALCGSLVHRRV